MATFRVLTKTKRVVEFSFEHDVDEYGPHTVCEGSVDGTPYRGYAYCHAEDQFVKDVGRKISLGRFLYNSGLEKGERTEVWHRYFLRGLSNREYERMQETI